MTERMPWPEFMLPYEIRENIGPDLMQTARFQMRIAGQVSWMVGDYAIRAGLYSQDEVAYLATHKVHGPLFLATLGDKIVGFTRRHYTWVDKAHHRKGLSAAMIAAVFLATGREKWMDSRYVRQKKLEPFTRAGYAAQKAAYKLLVEKKLIDPGVGPGEDIFKGDWGRQ